MHHKRIRNLQVLLASAVLALPSSFAWTISTAMGFRKGVGVGEGGSAAAVAAGAAGLVTVVAATGLYWQQQQQSKQVQGGPQWFTPARNSLLDQTIVITGGTTGLGLESAKRLAVGGASIVVTARSESKGVAAVENVQTYLDQMGITRLEKQTIRFKIVDLDSLGSVRESVKSWDDIPKIDVLINNAGVMAIPTYETTVDGFERQFQSNHLGHFLLTSLVACKLSPNARIINISSEAHKFAMRSGLDLAYIFPTSTSVSNDRSSFVYGPWKSYGQSKLANILFTQELQRKIDSAGLNWSTVAVHPGTVGTDLIRNQIGPENWEKLQTNPSWWQTGVNSMISMFLKSVEQGATTQVWLASKADEDVGLDQRKIRD